MSLRTGLAVVMVVSLTGQCQLWAQSDEGREPHMVQEQLQAFLDGKLPPDKLEITYSDRHGLLGGLTMTVRGTGKVEQEAIRRQVPDAVPLDAAGVRELVKLLLDKEAWKKAKAPTMPELPGEVFATLKISAGDAKSSISERVRDMKAHDRILPIMLLMQKLAWPKDGAK